ncbi:MAG TPA: mannosyltransferase [Leeuwenhoekiella sp.]|nr:mannosyltransferase [Leeuwenhoekiella sp.]
MELPIQRFFQLYKIPLLLVLSSLAMYWAFAYDLQRWDFTKLITLYAALCFLAYKIISIFKGNWKVLVGISVVFRLAFLLATPNLSQDFYRFIWDGRLLLAGINPYLFTPIELLNTGTATIKNSSQLFTGMGTLSATHHTNYPPINQIFFAIASVFSAKGMLGSIISLRLIIILADLGVLYFARKILRYLKLPEYRIFWYVLNPFIIIELTGNLHFEGVMLFFMLASIYLLIQKKWIWGGVLLGISVSLKLLPLLFLPLLWQFLIKDIPTEKSIPEKLKLIFKGNAKGILKPIAFYVVVLLTTVITFIPFLSQQFIPNFLSTIDLWFQKFEFNASIYYILRWIGFQDRGYNMIAEIGTILPKYIFAFIVLLSFLRKNNTLRDLFPAMLFAVSFYFLLATTVHPWYIATPLLLCIFTKYRFPIIWSGMVFLSYSAYGENIVDENLWIVALEYFVVIGYAVWEFNITERKVV